MTDKEQKDIFSFNLTRYVNASGKQQKEIARDLNVNEKTFNGWCKGLSMPGVWMIQGIADYFHITKSDLLDRYSPDNPSYHALTNREYSFIVALRMADDGTRRSVLKLLDIPDDSAVGNTQAASEHAS